MQLLDSIAVGLAAMIFSDAALPDDFVKFGYYFAGIFQALCYWWANS